MKVELSLRSAQINYLAQVFDQFGKLNSKGFVSLKREHKVIISICVDVADKFADKFKKISRSTTLFDDKKKYKVTLKFYEAHAIHVYLLGHEQLETDAHKKNLALTIMLIIEPKLQ